MIKISADSTCDLSPQILQALDISIIPLDIIVGEQAFQDGVNITPADIFRYVDQEGIPCKTAAVNTHTYIQRFEEFLTQYDAVIHICISSEFSACYQNALQAAGNFQNVYVVDSRNLSTGSGHIVYDAALMAKQGLEPAEICRTLENTVPKVEASFVIDRLDYLQKGGRCSALTALSAKLLRIKPCIQVTGGIMTVGKKYRGSFDKCLRHYIKDRLQDRDDIDTSRIFVTHSICAEETVRQAIDAVRKYADFDEIIDTDAGCTVSSHCGPGTLGILFKRK